MIKKIEYTNKEAIQNDSTIAEKNKVTDADMNEIKDVVNSNADELNSNKGTLSYTEKASETNKKNIDILIENFDKEIAEGTEIDLENTAEALVEVVEIAGNTKQDGEPSLENEVEVAGVTGDTETLINNGLQSSEANYKSQLQEFSLGDKTLYGDENARDFFNITIDKEFYQKTGYRKITSLDLVRNWKKYEVTGNEDIKFASNSTNIFAIINAITGNSLTSNDGYCSHFKVWKDYVESYPGWVNLEDGYCIVGRTTYHQILCKSLQFDNDLEGFKSKLQALKSAGTPMYVLFILEIPETENITDQTLISEIENFINNSYTYKQATSINSDFYLKLNYRKNMYYDLENRISALEQAQIL